MVAASILLLVGLGPWAASAQGPQKQEAPKWMTDDGKDLYSDIMAADHPFDDATCEIREKLLATLRGIGDKEAGHYRYLVLKEIGMCEFNKGDFDKAKKRIDSGISELNLPNDDMMLTNPELAPTGLLREAAKFMKNHDLTQAATALRRAREISERGLKKILKMIHKQMSGQEGSSRGNIPPVETLLEELSGYGRTGQVLPMLMPQAPILKQELPFAEQIDKAVESLDKRLAGFAPQLKAIRTTLDSKSKGGTLMYVRGLVSDAIAPGDRFMAAMEMVEGGVVKAFKEEAASAEKSATLLKRTKQGSGCGKGFTKTCEALAKIGDLKSNSFGETRVVIVKAGKKQQLEACSTNANLGIILAAEDGVSLSVGAEKKDLLVGLPVVVDFCQEVTLSATKQAAVLFAQAWHPEFAAVERTTELRSRSKAFDLSEDEVKAAVKIVNDNAKKSWEKSGKQWRNESPFQEHVKTSLGKEANDAKTAAEEAAEAKKKEDEANDTDRAENLKKLEAKRAAKKQAQADAEAKRLARKKQLEAERASRDPWLNEPAVLEVEKKLADLKEARRDASAKLEFDLTSELSKDINAAERELKKVTKKARKAFKKGGGKAAPAEEKKAEAEGSSADKIADIKKKLDDVKKEKEAAADGENFKEAKRLKVVQKDLEDKLKKLEL